MTFPATAELRRSFGRIGTAGILFQGGAAAVDTSTIVAALVHGLTGSPFAVGAAAAISRYGWLFPQLFVAYLAQGRRRRMPFYVVGALGRVVCLGGLAALLWLGAGLAGPTVVALFFVLWAVFAFVSGIVAVPYNDIVARAVPSPWRSRLLALRFFGGGLLALAVAGIGHQLLEALPFPSSYAVIFLLGALLLAGSAASFISNGELPAPATPPSRFGSFLLGGLEVLRSDRRFRLFLGAQWLGGVVAMALPFYVLQFISATKAPQDVALLLAAQTVGALLSNPLWGWWGDHRGKLSLLALVAGIGAAAPALTVWWIVVGGSVEGTALVWFGVVFFLLGAVGTGGIIAQLGYLMEISPDDRRPAYSGYFNALAAPAALLPMAGAAVAEVTSFAVVFTMSLGAALLQVLILGRLRTGEREAEA